MLETIREYALEQLAARGELETVRQRHAAYYLARAEEAAAEYRPTWLWNPWQQRVGLDLDNVRAALQGALEHGEAEVGLRLAVALQPLWLLQGPQVVRDWLAALLALPGTVPKPVRAKALTAALGLEIYHGDRETIKARAEENLTLGREVGDRSAVAWALLVLGQVAAAERTGQAWPLVEESLARFVELGDLWGIMRAYQAYRDSVELAVQEGGAARVQALLEQSLAHFRRQGNLGASAKIAEGLGLVAGEQGDFAQATAWLEESVGLYRQLGDQRGVAVSLHVQGELALLQGDDARAQALEEESLARFRELGDTNGMGSALINLGYVAQHQGAHAEAFALGVKSLAIAREEGTPHGIVLALECLVGAMPADRAARLLGVTTAFREATLTQPMAARRQELDRILAATRAELDEATFEAAWAEGRAMSLEQAIAYALEET
jgi:tetratricopeptide (TPR) repeat protein